MSTFVGVYVTERLQTDQIMSTNMHPTVRRRRWPISLLLPLVVVTSVVGQDSMIVDPHRQEVIEGRKAFTTYCASCHGPEGRGNGPVASVLTTTPPDLTQLKKKFEGVYPSEYVLRTVDGRHEFLAHGTRQMPIWGNIWRDDSTSESEVEVQRRLNTLLHYLETIQE